MVPKQNEYENMYKYLAKKKRSVINLIMAIIKLRSTHSWYIHFTLNVKRYENLVITSIKKRL